MKKVLLALIFSVSLCVNFSSAQMHLPKGYTTLWNDPFEPLSSYYKAEDSRFMGAFNINYSQSNFDNAIYIFASNYRYSAAAGDTSFRWFIVGIDSIYNSNMNQGYPWKSVSTMNVDSIMIYMGHENNSGTNDSLIVKMVSVNANGYPTGTVYWSDTLISNVSMVPPFNTWLFPQVKRFYPNYTFNAPTRFAIRVEYYGSKLDTFGVMAGFVNGGFCPYYGTSVSATKSHFYPNSYYYYTAFNNQYPTSAGGNVYIDCNGNGSYTVNSNEEYYIQNLNIWPHVTANVIRLTASTSQANLCNGQSTILVAQVTDGTPTYSYQWSPATGLSSTTILNPTANPTHTTIYTCTVTDSHGAKASDTVKIIVRPEFIVSNDTTICFGGTAQLFADSCLYYLWGPASSLSSATAANPVASPGANTVYTCQCTGFDGCVGTMPVSVAVTQLPLAGYTVSAAGLSVQFNNNTSGANNYLWNFGDSQTSNLPFPVHTYSATGSYIVTLIAYNACGSDTTSDTLWVSNSGISGLSPMQMFSIVPNPANHEIRVGHYFFRTEDELIVTDLLGKELIRQSNFSGMNPSLDISKLTNGAYFLTLKTENGIWVQRWMKE